jgi:hypothetical protein
LWLHSYLVNWGSVLSIYVILLQNWRSKEDLLKLLIVYWRSTETRTWLKVEDWRNVQKRFIQRRSLEEISTDREYWSNKLNIKDLTKSLYLKRDIKILYYIKYINIILEYGRNIPDNWYTQWNRIFGCPIQTSYASVLIHSSIIPYLLYMQIYVNVNIHNLYIYIEYICL